jgi:putative FmdB family regulatory protein
MPLYDYQCRACSKVTEVRHGFRETYDATCAACGGDLARVFNPAGIVFKGSGFYVTDSRKASSTESSSDSSSTTPPAPSTDSAAKKSESSAA